MGPCSLEGPGSPWAPCLPSPHPACQPALQTPLPPPSPAWLWELSLGPCTFH